MDFDPDMAPLFGALAKARGEFPDIPRNRTAVVRMKSGGQYSYKYADLADVFKAVNQPLAAYGLAVSQYPANGNIVTVVMHECGAIWKTEWPIKALPQRGLDDAQSFQSAVQMAKRYALTAALGITTEETVEGDPKAQRKAEAKPPMNEKFETEDGIHHPSGAVLKADMTARQRAAEVARAIEAQFDNVKTPVGLNGVWNRNEVFINALAERHDDLFQNVYDKFHSLLEQMEGAE